MVGVGASWRPSKTLSVDVGYSHIFVDDSSINQLSRTEGTLKGQFESQIDVVGVQFNWQF